ncbi:uncharacterized protein BEWA_000750 [Theileria equi strain WA]|uniref:Membrane protein, putative n=1 Tax=Theileria equi strain WA TaxID=1537102 RepID=L0AYM8_THEEQ|nr:uncharacterized protein BEWA_000750 [Theileria equi strain WA]AFZ80670.1 membrane protein, putative [Theileria equi strain WA]|eukprot:XP_004830336.1 uncharacterized protein BEWA_000750 [Theileria equi strain WA]
MALWGYGFNKETRNHRNRRYYGIFYLASMFTLPYFTYHFCGNTIVTKWFLKNIIPVYYPPESDPKIISRIYHSKDD